MTLTQLSYIVAVDKYRHFATAAQNIYITQPTLSMQIQKLEDELGVKIFDRSKTPVVPTEIGAKIIEQAKIILSGSKHIEDMVAVEDGILSGNFRVGIIPTIAPYLVPLFLKTFITRHPHVRLTFEEALTNDILTGLQEDYFDAGIIATATTQQFYEEELYLEPFLAYFNVNHKLAEKNKIDPNELTDEDVWLLNQGHCFRDQALKICKQINDKKEKRPITFESGNLETLKRLVEQDFGMTLMPYLAATQKTPENNLGVYKEFKEPVPTRKIRLVYSREFLKNNVINAFSEVIREAIPAALRTQKEELVIN